MTLREEATLLKALGYPVRLAMVQRLAQGECCVCELLELGEVGNVSGPTVSQQVLLVEADPKLEETKVSVTDWESGDPVPATAASSTAISASPRTRSIISRPLAMGNMLVAQLFNVLM